MNIGSNGSSNRDQYIASLLSQSFPINYLNHLNYLNYLNYDSLKAFKLTTRHPVSTVTLVTCKFFWAPRASKDLLVQVTKVIQVVEPSLDYASL